MSTDERPLFDMLRALGEGRGLLEYNSAFDAALWDRDAKRGGPLGAPRLFSPLLYQLSYLAGSGRTTT